MNDSVYVYVLPIREIMQIDYFGGELGFWVPVAQMAVDESDSESEPHFLAAEMFSTRCDGRTVRATITLQRRWRKKRLRSRIHTARMMLQHTARTQADRMALRAWWIRSRFFG